MESLELWEGKEFRKPWVVLSLFPVSCPWFPVINDWEGKMRNREGEREGNVIY